jgi:glycosyltransferase involved in cell wall biosynthesis
MEFPAMNRKQRRAQSTDVAPVTVLWHSNVPWATTGYGTQTKQVVERMNRDGHAIAVNANYGLQGTKMVWEDVPIFPMGVEAYSNDTVRANFASWKKENPDNPAHVIVLFDAWTMPKKMYEGVPVSIWTMVDHQPIPPKVLEVLQWDNVTPIAVTEFGLDQMRRAGLTKALYIPMAIDCDVYKPTGTFEGQTGREIIGFDDDDFVVSIINANKASGAGGIHRKAWAENILAFSIFAQDKPDARLYMHTERYGNYGGLALDFLAKACGLRPEQYRFVNQHAMHNGIPNEAMAAIFSATDCLLAATLAEGFGLTVLEAQACGTVAVVNNFSAQPELLGDGWLTEGQPYWDGAQLAWFNTPNIPSIVDGLEAAYARGKGRSDKARQHALKYDADRVWAEYWRPYLAHLAQLKPVADVVQLSSTPQTWDNGIANDPTLTIYIPAYRRPEISNLLTSLRDQLTDTCEVIVTDDDPQGSAWPHVSELLAGAPCRVEYHRNVANLGSIPNCMRAYEMARGPWLWVLGDDDELLDGAVAEVLSNLRHVDRLILLTEQAPRNAAGMTGTAAEIAATEPGLLIAATCTTANVWRIDSLNKRLAMSKLDTAMSYSFADTGCQRVRVIDKPLIVVGANHANEALAHIKWSGDMGAVWQELLACYGVQDIGPEHFAWNFVSVQTATAATA